jgi:hypothetical protein
LFEVSANSLLLHFGSRVRVDPTIIISCDVVPSGLELVAESPQEVAIYDVVECSESAVTESIEIVGGEKSKRISKTLPIVDSVVLHFAAPWAKIGYCSLLGGEIGHQGTISNIGSWAVDSSALVLVHSVSIVEPS